MPRALRLTTRVGGALAALGLVVGSPAAGQDSSRVLQQRTVYDDLSMFSQVLNQIRINHPDTLDTHELFMAAIEGLVRAADPHSYVLPAMRLSPERQEALRRGQLHPVPIEFVYVAQAPVVVSVRPGTAAAELDILPGDELVAIDGRGVAAESAPELDIALAGKKGSSITLTFRRRTFDGPVVSLERTVKRERVEEGSALGTALMLDERTGYVRVIHFGVEGVAREVRDSLRSLERRGMQRLVLDLRDNGGGLVDEAADLAGEFLPKSAVIYTAEGRKRDVADTVRVRRSSPHSGQLPLVVLVNGGTASAAELVTGALQDYDRAVVAGQPTFGKSLLMRGFPLTDGSIIFLVVGHVRTPCGRIVQRRYRDVRTHDYYRQAGTQDTTGRASCRTRGGRTVYGGGGIYPDVVIPRSEFEPRWVARIREHQILLRWIGGYLSAAPATSTTPDAFARSSLSPDIVHNFLAFAAADGIAVPPDAATNESLQELLLRGIARGRWGSAGYHRVVALRDDEVARAATALEQAASLLSPP